MKKLILLLPFIFTAFISCEDFDLEDPKASFRVLRQVGINQYEETTTFTVGEEVLIENTSTGETFTIFTGDKGRDGSSPTYVDNGVEKINTGFNLNHHREGVHFKYTYTEAGNYIIKVIAVTSYGEGDNIRQDYAIQEITVLEP